MERRRQICFALKEMNNLIRRKIEMEFKKEVKRESNNGCMGRTAIQRWIMEFVFTNTNKGKDIFQKDIEKQFSIRRSTATSVLKTMEKKEMIIREPSKDDARMKKISLTPQSAEKCIEVRQTIDEFEKTISDGISQEELDIFFEVIDKLKDNLK